MTILSVFDFADINRRLKDRETRPICSSCLDLGWRFRDYRPYLSFYEPCHTCKNPENKPEPER